MYCKDVHISNLAYLIFTHVVSIINSTVTKLSFLELFHGSCICTRQLCALRYYKWIHFGMKSKLFKLEHERQ